MTYDLRRLRLHGLIARLPHTHQLDRACEQLFAEAKLAA